MLPLTSQDTVNGTHRGHHQFLAKVLHHLAPAGIDPTQPFPADIRQALLTTLAEICGLDRGFSHGRGGSMHLQWHEAGAIGTNAIVGGGVPLAAGSAWAHRHAGTDAVAVTYFGDGASNIGSTLETFNLAAAWRLPLCFFIENNQYAVSTNVREATGEPRLSARGPGFGIPSWKVDGMDPLAVYLTMQARPRDHAVRRRPDGGRGRCLPVLPPERALPRQRLRLPHEGGGAGVAGSRSDRPRRPSTSSRRGILYAAGRRRRAQSGRKGLMADIGGELLEPLPEGKPGERRIKPSEWPDPAFVDVGVRGDLSEFTGARVADVDSFTGATHRDEVRRRGGRRHGAADGAR